MNEKKMIEKEKKYIKLVIILLNNSSICPVEKKYTKFSKNLRKRKYSREEGYCVVCAINFQTCFNSLIYFFVIYDLFFFPEVQG